MSNHDHARNSMVRRRMQRLGAAAVALVAVLVALLAPRVAAASTPQVFVGTPIQVGEYGAGTHLKFVTLTLYDRPYTPGGDAQILRQWYAWAPSNNEIRPGVPLNDPSRNYQPATYRNGTPVPHPVEGNGGHARIQMEIWKAAGPQLVEDAFARYYGSQGDIIMRDAEAARIVFRAGGLTVDGEGKIASVATKSSVNEVLTEHTYGIQRDTGVDIRKMPQPEAEIWERDLRAAVAPPCECFVGGTPIATRDGPRPIEKVKVGDEVWGTDGEGKPSLRRVLHTFADPPRLIRAVKLQAAAGRVEKLETTDEHPFYVEGRGWTHAAALVRGDRVSAREGAPAVVVSSEPTGVWKPTFNFEVEGSHDYFAGVAGARVHNLCAVPRPPNRMGRFMTFMKQAGRMDVGGPGVVVGGIAVGMIGYALGGEYGALAAGFAYGTIAGKMLSQGAMSWSTSAALSGAGMAAALLTDYALKKAGVKQQWIRTAASIGAGSLVPALYAGYAAYAAPGGTLGAAGAATASTFVAGCLWAVLALEVVYHVSQWIEIGNAIYLAANGSQAHEDALREIERTGFGSRYDPSLYIRYGIVSWVTRPGEILSDLWRNGL